MTKNKQFCDCCEINQPFWKVESFQVDGVSFCRDCRDYYRSQCENKNDFVEYNKHLQKAAKHIKNREKQKSLSP